jgi:iron complex outermembrane recepter protein
MIRSTFGRMPCGVFALSVLACGPVAAQTLLAPVIVTATRFTDDANGLPFGVSVITAADLRKSGATTVNEALMKLLGVPGRLDFYGGGDYMLDLRGFGATADSNQVVIVDGVRLSEADQGGTRLAGIPIDSVERIEVVRASSAVLYGEGATGGAIVVTTKGADGDARSARGYLALGSRALTEARAGASLGAGDLSLDVSGGQRVTDGHRANFRSNVENLSGALQWRHEGLRAGVRHAEDKLRTGLPGALTAAEYDADPWQTTHPLDSADIANHNTNVFAQATFGDWHVGLDAGRRRKELRSMTSFGGGPLSSYDYDIDARQNSVRARHARQFGSLANVLSAGADRATWSREVRSFGAATTAEQRSNGVYLQDDLTFGGGTRVNAGVRREHARKTSDAAGVLRLDERLTAWDFGILQPLGRGVSVFARAGRSFRFANADEAAFTVTDGLRPQTSRDLDVGARWVHAAGRAELRLYRNALKDEIGYDPAGNGPFGPFGANVNLDRTRRQGAELELLQRLSADWQLRVNAAARQAKFTAGPHEGHSTALVPRRTLAVGGDWQLGSGHQLTGLVNAVSSQYPDFENTCSMPSYATADLRYAYRTAQVELAFGVANVTDRKYYTQAFSCTGGPDGRPTSIYPEAGRAFTASARVSF